MPKTRYISTLALVDWWTLWLTPSTRVYELGAEYAVMEYSGAGDVTG